MSDLQSIIALVKANRKDEARRRLVDLLRLTPDNEKAWLCMASCVTNRQELEACIGNVLRINPASELGHKLIARYHLSIADMAEVTPQHLTIFEDLGDTVPSRPTVMLKQSAISEALAAVQDVLDEHKPPPTERKRLSQELPPLPEPVPASRRHRLKRLRQIMLAAILILALALIVLVGRDQWQNAKESATLTAQYVEIQSAFIEQANAATIRAEEQRATRVFGTETAFAATESAKSQTAVARLAFIDTVSTAFLSDPETPQIEPRDTFQQGEPVSVVVELTSGVDLFELHVQIFLQNQDGDLPIDLQAQNAWLTPSPTTAIFTFDSTRWPLGSYVAQVFIQREAGPSTAFNIN